MHGLCANNNNNINQRISFIVIYKLAIKPKFWPLDIPTNTGGLLYLVLWSSHRYTRGFYFDVGLQWNGSRLKDKAVLYVI